ncbi:MAG: hypothetical protein UIH99_04780 [Alphaproteobacteria bacterium]|nr:hypothetical protein [Alphaproteobacteria bacterium]
MNLLKKLFHRLIISAMFIAPSVASAADIIDALDLSPFVPLVLDALMMVATGMYEYFVGNGNGIIYIFVWSFLGISIALYLLKLYIPKSWASIFGMSGVDNNFSGTKIFENVLKPGLRAVIAALALLQLKPVYLTQWLINPFLEFGAIYTNHIVENISGINVHTTPVECPEDVVQKAWISEDSCKFLTQPVADLSHANNQVIKRGFRFVTNGLRGLMTPILHGGEDLMNIITGIILIFTFVSCNIFMALLIIQGIFNFGMQIILYPFYVLTYVFKHSDKWFDIWPAFSGITKALQQLIVTMIACAFILSINVAIIRALFQWNSSVFVVSAGGFANSNVPQVAQNAMGFGQHSILWLSAILTFYLMFKIFDLTKKQLNMYVGSGMTTLYDSVITDSKTLWGGAHNLGKQLKNVSGWFKSK